MNPRIHKLSGRYCPFCLRALWQSIETGFEFCPDDPECGYEVREGLGKAVPLTLRDKQKNLLATKRGEIDRYQKHLAALAAECVALERELGESNALLPPA